MMANRIALVYHFFYSDTGKDIPNLKYFLKHGLSRDIDYYFYHASDWPLPKVNLPNVHYVAIQNNDMRDFNGYRFAAHNVYKKNYHYVFFMNSGMIGPIMSPDRKRNWWNYFLDLFDDDIHLVGVSVGMPTWEGVFYPHIQSMFFCLDAYGLEYALAKNIFDLRANWGWAYIQNFEFKLSKIFLDKGYNINAILPEFRDIDYRKITEDFNTTSMDGDPFFPGRYFGKTIDPYEAIFFKNTRGIEFDIIE
jgi:hypothetical protein